ncbi:TPR Domain containing protein [Ilyonectria robusta]
MRKTEIMTDPDTDIQYLQEAVDITPEDHSDRAGRLFSLGSGYRDRFLRKGLEEDLRIAIRHLQQAVDTTPEDHSDRASRLHRLGSGYQDRSRRKGSEEDLRIAIQLYEDALHHPSSAILHRLRPGRSLLTMRIEAKRCSSAYEAASTAVSLIALLAPRSLGTSDKQHLLTEVSGLASDAAAIALMAGKTPYEAMRLLELGRGVIAGSLNEMRADISDLLQKHPQLAEEYIKLRDQVNAPTRQVNQLRLPTVAAPQVSQRYDAGQKLERTIQAIRSLPGFDRFLMAPSEDQFKAAATSGPIVVINVSNHRCDALIIKELELKSVPLPHLSNSDIQTRAKALANPDSPDTQLLEWLWDTIAKPVLDALGFTQTPDGCLPRVWWVPTGPLAKFPIHAAGYHARGSDTVLDRVISSYSSSVRALVQSRQRRATLPVERGTGKAVLVSMEKTPGLDNLPFAQMEIDRLERLCSSLQLQVCKPQPCREDVLVALNDCDIFHFAGHGDTVLKDPSRSSLVLRGGPLAVADLFETNLHNRKPFLAYLSACGTGQIKNDGLIDEALHLITAYQIAGFRHVIGTLWGVNDKTCVEAATITYKWVQERNMTDDSVSEGLHRASMKLRESWITDNTTRAANRMAVLQDKSTPTVTEQARSSQGTVRDPRDAELYEEIPLYWVPYVHFGV